MGWVVNVTTRSLCPRDKDPIPNVPLYRRLGGPHGRFGWAQKISQTSGFDPRTVVPVASRYTDYAIPALMIKLLQKFN